VNQENLFSPFFFLLRFVYVSSASTTQWGHFMSVEIVIIDAILFRYISMLIPSRLDVGLSRKKVFHFLISIEEALKRLFWDFFFFAWSSSSSGPFID
jgi:hypothetical protein